MMKHKLAKNARNSSGRRSVRRMLAGMLTFCMLLTMLPGASLTAGATDMGGAAAAKEEIVAPTKPAPTTEADDVTKPTDPEGVATPEESAAPPTDPESAGTSEESATKPADPEGAATPEESAAPSPDKAAVPETRNAAPRAASIEYKVNGGALQTTDSISTAFGAMASATDASNSYVKLLNDVSASGATISKGKFTLDLNGKTWDVGSGCDIYNEGTQITVQDSGTAGKIIGSADVLDVLEKAALTLNSGTIEAVKGGRVINAHRNSSVDGGLITINGGTVRQIKGVLEPTNGVYLGAGGFLMTGGTIESNVSMKTLILDGGNNSIQGGTIRNTGGVSAVTIDYDGTLDISGGTVTASGSAEDCYAIYGFGDKGTVRLSGSPVISGQTATVFAQNGISLQANIGGTYYSGNAVSIEYKADQQAIGTTLVTGLQDATQAAKFTLQKPKTDFITVYDDTAKTLSIAKASYEARWTTDNGASWTKGTFLAGVDAMKSSAKDKDKCTLQLLTDISKLTDDLTLSSDSATAYTLDLNGKTLNAANVSSNDYFTIRGGRVDIKDSAGNGQIKGRESADASSALYVYGGKLTLKSGTITSSTRGIYASGGEAYIEGGSIVSSGSAVFGVSNSSIEISGGTLRSQTEDLIYAEAAVNLRLYGAPTLTPGAGMSTISAEGEGKIFACNSQSTVYYNGSPVTISCNWQDQKSGDTVVQRVKDASAAALFTAKNTGALVLKKPATYPGNLTLASKELMTIAITTPPTKTAYRVGDTFDKTGMVVTATYGSGTDADTKEVTGYTVSPSETETLKASDTTITVSYTEGGITKTAAQTITVESPFTVSFDADGGVGTYTDQNVFKNDKAAKPTDPTKAGYTFKGWFAPGQSTAFDFNTPITGNLTLTAKWADETAPTDVKISYDKNNWKEFLNNVTFGLFFKDTVDVKLEAKDTGSGVKEFTYTLGNNTKTLSAVNGAAEFSITTQYKGNIYNVTATDNAGNTSNPAKETQHFAVDTAVPGAPTVDTNGYTAGTWTKDTVTLTLSGASALSGIAKYQYSTDNGKSWNDAEVVTATVATTDEPYNMTQAKVEVSANCKAVSYLFRAVSNAGMEGTNSAETVVNIDKVKPAITVTGTTDSYLVEDTAKVEATAGDSKVTKVEVKKDNDAYKDITDSYDKGYKVTEKGTYTFRVTNGAGVTAEAAIIYTRIDATKPVVEINSFGYTPDTWEKSGYITLMAEKDVTHGTMQYKIGDGQWEDYIDSKAIFILEDCNATVYTFRATSGAGVVSDEKAITVKRDTKVPDGDITFNESSVKKFINEISFGLFFKETVNAKITGTDATSGVADIEYMKTDKVLTQDQIEAVTTWTKGDSLSLTPVDKEKFIIYVKVKDNAGHVFVFGSNGAEFDLTAPTITGVTNGAAYYTTQKAVVADQNIDKITLNGTSASSSVSLAGNIAASYVIKATDKVGNETSVTVTMKPIASLSATIDTLDAEDVTSGDKAAVEAVQTAVNAVVVTDAATKEEKEALKGITDKCTALLKKIAEVAAENKRITDAANGFDKATIKTSNKETLEELKAANEVLLKGGNLTEEEKTALTKVNEKITILITRVDEVAAENKRITDKANSFDEATIKTSNKETLDELKTANEALLGSKNLTEEETAALTEINEKITALIAKVEAVAAENERIIENANNFDVESVKTADKATLEQLKTDNEALLATENLTEEERTTLTEVNDKINALLVKVDAAENASTPESYDKIKDINTENVKMSDKEQLAQAKADLEKALAEFGDNYTEEEKAAMKEKIAQAESALKAIDNAQKVIDAIDALPNAGDVKKGDANRIRAAKKLYDSLSAHEKSMIAPEKVDKLNKAVTALEKELNKKPTNPKINTKAVKTGDNAAPMPFAVSVLLSGAIVLALILSKRRRQRNANIT